MQKDEFFVGSEWEIDPETMTENEHVLVALYRMLTDEGKKVIMNGAMQISIHGDKTK